MNKLTLLFLVINALITIHDLVDYINENRLYKNMGWSTMCPFAKVGEPGNNAGEQFP